MYHQKRLIFVLLLMLIASSVFGQVPEKTELSRLEKARQEMTEFGIDYLRFVQNDNGGFSTSPRSGIGISIIVLLGLMESGLSPDDPTVAKGLKHLLNSVQEDGGIYSPGGRISTYESCLALTCLQMARKKGMKGLDQIIAEGEKFIRGQQYNETNGVDKDDLKFGGLGYGGGTRPDLSNTQFFMETLHELGTDPNDKAMQDALVFVSRCQNLESEGNPAAIASKNPDGGFFYTCVGDGESPAGEVNGGLRSYGSITYAGLKSLIYAGLQPDDPRVKAASGWIRDNYSVTENPGLGKRGLYYYYHTMAKTLDVLGKNVFIDKDKKAHFWKADLIKAFMAAQNEDGYWVNDNSMWMENDINLVTGYALIVLAHCKTDVK